MDDRIHIIDDNIRGPDPAPAAGPAPALNRPVNPVIQAIDTYMGNQTQANLDNVSRIIRENNEDPRHFLSYAVSEGNANLVQKLIELAGNSREERAEAANYIREEDWGETPLINALTNPNNDNILPILRVLFRNGADPNLVADGRSNFFDAIYQDEMDSEPLGQQDRMNFLQSVRNLAREYNHVSPPEFQRRVRDQNQDLDPNNIIGGKKKRKRTQKKKKKSTKKTKRNRKSKKHRKK